jgi:hypothetical protein
MTTKITSITYNTDPTLRFLPRRFRNRVQNLLSKAYINGREVGIQDGRGHMQAELKKSGQNLRVDLSMSIQKLADSNAQIATTLVRCLEKLT